MFDLTIKEYLDAIQDLKIDDFIIFYFTAYFFVTLIQRALGSAVSTHKLSFNPKIMSSLVLVQLFRVLNDSLTSILLEQEPYIKIVFTAFAFVTLIFMFRLTVLSKWGVFRFFYYYHMYRAAWSDKAVQEKRGSLVDIDHTAIFNAAKDLGASRIELKNQIVIDFYISTVLIFHMADLNIFAALLFCVAVWFFASPRIDEITEFTVKHANRGVRGMHKNERRLDGDHAEPIYE